MKYPLVFLTLFFAFFVKADSFDNFFHAIATVESTNNPKAIGDHGKAVGIFQIHKDYWLDSKQSGEYNDCLTEAYSRKVVMAYWQRYCPDALRTRDYKKLASVHHLGPSATFDAKYWEKIQKAME